MGVFLSTLNTTFVEFPLSFIFGKSFISNDKRLTELQVNKNVAVSLFYFVLSIVKILTIFSSVIGSSLISTIQLPVFTEPQKTKKGTNNKQNKIFFTPFS